MASSPPKIDPEQGQEVAPRFDVEQETLLYLPLVLEKLVSRGSISQCQAEDVLIAQRSKKELNMHPLEIVASREYENCLDEGHTLDLETMTQWVAEEAKQPYVRVDPLKINVNAATEVMSYAFAQRHNILALEVEDDHVVIASCQPHIYQWEGMLTQTLRGRRINRVVANPADISRYQLEFYTIARSAAKAAESGMEVSAITNFEQILELGGIKSPEVNDARVVNNVG